MEKVQYKNVVFTVWDVGGQEKLRPLWKHYFKDTDALIYVVDCLDRDRIDRAKAEFQARAQRALLRLCALTLGCCAPLALCRRLRTTRSCATASSWCWPTSRTWCALGRRSVRSTPRGRGSPSCAHRAQAGAIKPRELCPLIGLDQMKSRKWHVQGTVATKGEGLYEGLDWLQRELMFMRRTGQNTSVGDSKVVARVK